MRVAWLVVLAGCDGVFGLYPITSSDGDGGVTSDADASVVGDVQPDVPVCMTTPFSGVQTYAIGSAPRGIARADMDGNGTLDIIVANSGGPTVGILRGNGNGTFQPVQTYSTTESGPSNLVVLDANGDLELDVVVATSGSLNLMRGDGLGGLGSRTTLLLSNALEDVAAGRLDNDADTDLAYTASSSVTPLFSANNGNFTAGQSTATAAGPEDFELDDFNGDTLSDAAVACFSTGMMQVFTNNGTGALTGPSNHGTTNGGNPRAIATGFINVDTDPDIAVLTAVYVNTWAGGGGTSFTGSLLLPTSIVPGGIAIGDLDGDGDGDLAFTNANTGTQTFALIRVRNDGSSLTALSPLPTGSNPGKLVIDDFDKDGRNDIVVVNRDSNNVSVYLGCPP